MILEVAEIHVKEGDEQAFIEAVSKAQSLFMVTDGYSHHELRQSMETPNRFLLLIHWQTLEAHTVDFRESDRFPQWRDQISKFFAKPPTVEHFEVRLK